MNSQMILLLTRDDALQKVLNQALGDTEAIVLRADNVGDALQVVCQHGRELSFAVIDFAGGCHGMTLLNALKMCRPHLPLIVSTSDDAYHASMLAYANEVAACLAKPILAAELKIVIQELAEPKLQLGAA
jgi:DNA-binding NtrC family response regulator